MARSRFVWVIVFETGETQLIKAQTLYQIINCNELIQDSDSIINITKMDLASSHDDHGDIVEIPFQD